MSAAQIEHQLTEGADDRPFVSPPDEEGDEIPFDFGDEAPSEDVSESTPATLNNTDVVEPESAPGSEEDLPPVDPHAGYVEVPTLDHMHIKHVLKITSSNQFLEIFDAFEDQIEVVLEPLAALLNKVIMSREVTQLDRHAAEVDSYRQRVSRYLSLTVAFVEHGKSSRFIMRKTKGYAEFDREAHKRSMTAGFVALQVRLECMLTDVDFRVNNCKKFSDQEKAGFKNFGSSLPQ